jgi:hypothetical protein
MIYGMDIDYIPENTRSKDLDHNKGKSVKEQGFHADDRGFHEAGEFERKDEYGRVVSHQDSTSMPDTRDP